jgi:catechol 2,3-dioxygenase
VNTGTPTDAYGIAFPEFRLPDRTHVGIVDLQVSDMPRSLAYYEQVLGLRTYASSADEARLGPHGDETPIVTLATKSGVTRARRGAFGLYHFAILLPDRGELGRFAAHLARLGVRTGTADHLVSEALYLWDPDGLGIEVYADRPRETWQSRNGELVMATDPLNVENLIAAGGGQRWDGMPRGAQMGHVHLHVGSLERAESFYHRALGLDKTVWSYPGALFLSAGGYHHHLATNIWSPGSAASANEARLLEWELLVPTADDVAGVGRRLASAGCPIERGIDHVVTADPWGTRVRVRADR